jgi:hypothetical protein
MNLSIARSLFHFSGNDTQPVPGNGPTVPSDGPTKPLPPSVGLGAVDGVDLTFAKTVVTCEEGTHPVIKTEGQTVTVTCEPDAPKQTPKQGKRNIPILD